jgi:aminoglycoside 3-N-acetyltransferase I
MPIHHLTPSDVSLFRAMNAMFARAFEDPDSYLGKPPSDAYIADLLAKPHVIALAAIREGDVVGGLVAYQLDKFEQDRREIYIYDLAVDEVVRRQGIATALIEALRVEAARRDAWVIFVQADLVDAPAIALYDKLGTKETTHHFDIAPAPKDDAGG